MDVAVADGDELGSSVDVGSNNFVDVGLFIGGGDIVV